MAAKQSMNLPIPGLEVIHFSWEADPPFLPGSWKNECNHLPLAMHSGGRDVSFSELKQNFKALEREVDLIACLSLCHIYHGKEDIFA